MQNSPYSEKIYELIKKEYPLLYDEHNSIIYLDHAGASLYSKSQINGFHEELEQNLLCNPHTNFGKLKVFICQKNYYVHEYKFHSIIIKIICFILGLT